MTDTGQIPGEGLPENAGVVEQPGIPGPGAYTFLDPSEHGHEEDDLLLMPGAQGAWSDPQAVQAVPQVLPVQPVSQAQPVAVVPDHLAAAPAHGGPMAAPQTHTDAFPSEPFPVGEFVAEHQPEQAVPVAAGGPEFAVPAFPAPGVQQAPEHIARAEPQGRAPVPTIEQVAGSDVPAGRTAIALQPITDAAPAVPAAEQAAPAHEVSVPGVPGHGVSVNEGFVPEVSVNEVSVPEVQEGSAHEAGGRDSGPVVVGAVRTPSASASAMPTPPPARRPLHMGPPMSDSSGGVVRSLADRGPADTPPRPLSVMNPGPATAGPEYLDIPAGIPRAEPAVVLPGPQLGEIPPQAGIPWNPLSEQIAHLATPVAVETEVPESAPVAPAAPAALVTPVAAAAAAAAVVAETELSEPGPDAELVTEPSTEGQVVQAEGSLPARRQLAPVPVAVLIEPETEPMPEPEAMVPAPRQAAAEQEQAAEAEKEAEGTEPEQAAEAVEAVEPEPVVVQEPIVVRDAVEVPEHIEEPQPEAEPEAEAQTGQADAVGATAPEPAVDAEPAVEPVSGPGPEPQPEAAPEAEPQTGQADAVRATAPEPAVDADPAPEPAAEAVSGPGTGPDPAPQPEAVPVPGPAPQPEAVPVPGPAPQSEAAPGPGPAPVAAGRDNGPAPAYDDAEREAVLRVMRERRDIRNGFRSDPIPHEVLLRVLEAAHTAPSVGHSQPWDFVVIRSAETRRTMHELAQRQREAYAKSLPKGRAKQFKELKIEAILDTPVNIVVTADPTRGGRHTLGRHTQPQMAPYSSALAVENLWLAARAEGLGVGWVSFFDEREMVRTLGLPEHLEVVAYLCVGYVDEFPEEPELMQAGWSKRRPLSWVVHEETYGRRALPGEEPHDLLQETVSSIRPLDAKALGEAWERQKRMTKPAGALGMLEIISAQLSGLSRMCPPPIPEPAAVAIFAGDHGVHAQGVTAWPQEVTGQMVANFLGGGAVCNAFANQVGAEVCVIDVGVATDLPATPGLLPRKVRPGTADFTTGPALSREDVLAAIEVGIETARDLVAAGNKALLTGEMGIANTTVSAALICVYTGLDPAEVTGRGTGINDEMHARKIDVVRRGLDLHAPDPADPIGVLSAVGGLEHAALVGFLLGGASLRTPVVLDGVSAGAAALVARAIAPEALAACIAGHRSAEPGHVAALNKLGLRPLVDLDLRLGEGTGALLALPVVQSAARAMHEVATFDSAGVTEK